MVLMQPRHSAYRPESLSTVSTILQPCAGGLEYIARMISVIWDLDTRRHTSHVTPGLLLGMVVPEVGGQLLVLEHHREIASSLIVESEILGEGL